LTDLPNRREFVTQLGETLRHNGRCAIIFCDLDHFKAVNDRYGHAQGDEVLVEVAKRLRSSVRADDLVSRFGGDEFVILLRNKTPKEVQTINERITQVLSRPVQIPVGVVTIGASTGIVHSADDVDPEGLIRRADHAMYEAKGDGASGTTGA
jgi:diguanylate cyclase (GGDEF)-like protein